MRRLLFAVAALVLGLGDARSAEITRILVGFPPGQATDMVARLLADRLAPLLGESVIVENRPGQGGSIVLGTLLQTPADGHTMVLAPLASMVVNPHMYKSISYDIFRDFAPVAQVADLPLLLVTNPSLPVKTLSELIAYAKANPGKLSNPSSGNGTLSHLGMELFKQRAGISIVHVPYRGSPQAMVDLMGGIVDVAMDTVPVTEPFIRAGKMRLIATAYGKRVPAFPDTSPSRASRRSISPPGSASSLPRRHRRSGSIASARRSTRSRSRPRSSRSSQASAPSRARWVRPSSARFSKARTRAGARW